MNDVCEVVITLMMETVNASETLINFYQTAPRNVFIAASLTQME